jgi:hypothetical protein
MNVGVARPTPLPSLPYLRAELIEASERCATARVVPAGSPSLASFGVAP